MNPYLIAAALFASFVAGYLTRHWRGPTVSQAVVVFPPVELTLEEWSELMRVLDPNDPAGKPTSPSVAVQEVDMATIKRRRREAALTN